MFRLIKFPSLIVMGLALLAPQVAASPAEGEEIEWVAVNHAFDVSGGTATVCLDGAIFDGGTTGADSLNLLMTSQVFDAPGTSLLGTGNTHTFTSVGETFTFTVSYPMGSVNVGDGVRLSVSDNPPTLQGAQGDVANGTVANCSLATVPTMPWWGGALLALLIAAGGTMLLARRGRAGGGPLRVGALLLLAVGIASAAGAQPTFTKVFGPDTIGPGTTSILTFTITNASASPVTDLAFTDTLPGGVTISPSPQASTTCNPGEATLSAPAGGITISLSGGSVGGSQSCTVKVNVVGSTVGTKMNVSGDLTSSAGNSGTAADDLDVTSSLPGFSKSFSPSSVEVGGRTTLTFLFSASVKETSLSFTDTLPTGMVVADPANVTTDCGTPPTVVPTVTATPGTGSISFSVFGSASFPAIDDESSCTVSVDVTPNVAGTLANRTNQLVTSENDFAGYAAAALTSVGAPLGLRKKFLDDPVPPGGTVTVEFRIDNRNRDFSATAIGFTDDLDFTPSTGITFDGGPFPDPPCGAGSTLTLGAGDVLTLAGGTLAPGGFCVFTVSLGVPVSETVGAHVNTTGAVAGTVDGMSVVGNTATDFLYVDSLPIFTKEFIDDPVGSGGTVTLEFTITNPDPTATQDMLAFTDDLETAIAGLAANSLVDMGVPDPLVDPCGSGSELTVFSFTFGMSTFVDPTILEFSGGTLAEAGMPGDSCTFSVVLDVPTAPGGIYTNTTSELTGKTGMTPFVRGPASDDLVILGAPRLTKEFIDDPVVPGVQVTLEFTLEHNIGSPGDATSISFTDDLTSTGLGMLKASAGELPLTDACGPGNGTLSGSAGDTLLTFSGGTLMPGEECTFSLLLDVPSGAGGGSYTNTTSGVGATVDDGGSPVASTSRPASDDLVIAQVAFSKSFTDDPVLPGASATLEFTLVNLGADAATAIFFTDDLDPGLLEDVTVSALPADGFCGAGSTLTTSNPMGSVEVLLTMSGASLAPAGSVGDSCTFSITLDIPAAALDGNYANLTSNLFATIDSTFTILPPAFDVLVVESDLLFLTKAFIDDPIPPGSTGTLRFTIANLDPDDPISGIAFSDDLDAAMTGLKALGLPLTPVCGGTLSTTDGGLSVDFTGGSVAAGDSCFFDVTIEVPSPLPGLGPFVNTTTVPTGTIGGLSVFGGTASDTLSVDTLLLTKAFDGPTVAGGSPVLTFTIENLSSTSSVSDLAFSDSLDDTLTGLVATSLPAAPCGAGSMITGTATLAFSGGNLPPGGICSFDADLSVPGDATPGDYPNTTTPLTVSGLTVAAPATDTLTVEPPPLFSKAFSPDMIGQGFDTTLTFTIDNTASALAATGLAFLDMLPIGLEVAAAPMVTNSCGGSVVASAGSVSISLSGGSVGALATCTISVKVTAVGAGALVNTTADLTSSSGNSGTATDTVTVAGCLAADGVNLTIAGEVILAQDTREVCNTIEVREHTLVLGPDGVLTLRAGVAVTIFDGVEIGDGGELEVEIDPSLIP